MKLLIAFIIPLLLIGCNSYQPTKNVWKTTKGLWNTYVSQPAYVDYDEKGELSPSALLLSQRMMGIDVELSRLERVLLNADKPPTQEWLQSMFQQFPWVNGIAGVRPDGEVIGHEPSSQLKELDFIPLLYEDHKQSSRALRSYVQITPLGPEIMIGVPLYDASVFKGIIAVHFDLRNLVHFSDIPEDMVALSPDALLWPGKYDYAATPLSGVEWAKVVTQSTSGTCSNSIGSFYYLVRFMGNLPLVFASTNSKNFPSGNGELEQGVAFFPKEQEKLPPPPLPEKTAESRPNTPDLALQHFASESGKSLEMSGSDISEGEINPGSSDSVLLKKKAATRNANVNERRLEGEDVPVQRASVRKKASPQKAPDRKLELLPEQPSGPTLPDGRPSPFGAKSSESASVDPNANGDAGKANGQENGNEKDEESISTLPGGRPSPFGN